jgi:hypothetical protein
MSANLVRSGASANAPAASPAPPPRALGQPQPQRRTPSPAGGHEFQDEGIASCSLEGPPRSDPGFGQLVCGRVDQPFGSPPAWNGVGALVTRGHFLGRFRQF